MSTSSIDCVLMSAICLILAVASLICNPSQYMNQGHSGLALTCSSVISRFNCSTRLLTAFHPVNR